MAGIVLFGDSVGVEGVLPLLPPDVLSAIVGAGNRPQYQEHLCRLARSLGRPYLHQPRADSAERDAFTKALRALKPDLILVYSYSLRLDDALLALPRLGCVNIHGGPLPEYRGCNPIQWAIATGDDLAGASIHLMDTTFDTGPLLARECFRIGDEETWAEVSRRVHALALRLLAGILPALLAGTAPAHEQDERRARHWRRRGPDDSAFTWDWPCRRIHDCIRASVTPLPGAYCPDAAGRRSVIETYVPLAEVARRKLRRRPLTEHGLVFGAPLAPEQDKTLNLTLHRDRRLVARVCLDDITARGGECRARIQCAEKDAAGVKTALVRFAREELATELRAVFA